MVRSLEFEVGHFAFDNAGINPVTTRREGMTGNIPEKTLIKTFMLSGMHHLEFSNGRANEVDGLDETETIRVNVGAECGFVHDGANDKMGQQSRIQFLNDPHRVQRTQGTG